jgi:hypothetical protein
MLHRDKDLDGFIGNGKWMRFGKRNVKSLCRVGSQKTVASEMANYNTDIVAVQGVRWDECGSQLPDCYTFSTEMGMLIIT